MRVVDASPSLMTMNRLAGDPPTPSIRAQHGRKAGAIVIGVDLGLLP